MDTVVVDYLIRIYGYKIYRTLLLVDKKTYNSTLLVINRILSQKVINDNFIIINSIFNEAINDSSRGYIVKKFIENLYTLEPGFRYWAVFTGKFLNLTLCAFYRYNSSIEALIEKIKVYSYAPVSIVYNTYFAIEKDKPAYLEKYYTEEHLCRLIIYYANTYNRYFVPDRTGIIPVHLLTNYLKMGGRVLPDYKYSFRHIKIIKEITGKFIYFIPNNLDELNWFINNCSDEDRVKYIYYNRFKCCRVYKRGIKLILDEQRDYCNHILTVYHRQNPHSQLFASNKRYRLIKRFSSAYSSKSRILDV